MVEEFNANLSIKAVSYILFQPFMHFSFNHFFPFFFFHILGARKRGTRAERDEKSPN